MLLLATFVAQAQQTPAGMSFSKFDCVLGGTGWKILEDSDGDRIPDNITIKHCNGCKGHSASSAFTSPQQVRDGYTFQHLMLPPGEYTFNVLSEDGTSVLRIGTISLEPED